MWQWWQCVVVTVVWQCVVVVPMCGSSVNVWLWLVVWQCVIVVAMCGSSVNVWWWLCMAVVWQYVVSSKDLYMLVYKTHLHHTRPVHFVRICEPQELGQICDHFLCCCGGFFSPSQTSKVVLTSNATSFKGHCRLSTSV